MRCTTPPAPLRRRLVGFPPPLGFCAPHVGDVVGVRSIFRALLRGLFGLAQSLHNSLAMALFGLANGLEKVCSVWPMVVKVCLVCLAKSGQYPFGLANTYLWPIPFSFSLGDLKQPPFSFRDLTL